MTRRTGKTSERTRDDEGTVATRVAHLLRDDIVRGILAGGERLNEAVLADRYKVSRIPLREALRIVEGQGLIEIRSFSGAFVSQFSTDEIVDIFEIHQALEAIAIRLALPHLTPEDFRVAEHLARKAGKETNARRWLELTNELYSVLYGRIGRRHLSELLHRLVGSESRYLFAFFNAIRTYQPDIPSPRDFVNVLRKRDINLALEFHLAWRRAQREFLIRHMSSVATSARATSSPSPRARRPRIAR